MADDKKRIVFCGGIFRDWVTCTSRFPAEGETLFGSKCHVGYGGKCANQSVMCSKLNSYVAILGKVGQDNEGRAYRDHLVSCDVDVSHLMDAPKEFHTGIATIWVNTATGQNKIIIVPGANDTFTAEDVVRAKQILETADAAVFSLEANMEGILTGLRLAKEHGSLTMTNATPARPDFDPELFELTDLLCVNETEAQIISDWPVVPESEGDFSEVMKRLLAKCPIVVITLGEKGAVFATRQEPLPEKVSCPDVDDVVDTTGAGDAFVGSLAYFWVCMRLKLETAVKRACFVASLTVRREGTQSSYPLREDLPAWLFTEL